MEDMMSFDPRPTRRTILRGALGAGLTLGLSSHLASCSSDDRSAVGTTVAPANGSDTIGALDDFERLGDTGMPTSDAIQSWIEQLTEFGARWPGSEAIKNAESYIKEHFETAGLTNVRFEEYPTWTWEATNHSFTVNGTEIKSFPVYHSGTVLGRAGSFGTGSSGIEAPIVDIGDASNWDPSDVRDRIVVFDLKFLISGELIARAADYLWDPELSLAASEAARSQANPYLTNMTDVIEALVKAGAVGFCGVLADYFESNRYINEYHPGSEMPIPGVWVSPSEGERLHGLLLSHPDDTTGILVLEGEQEETNARVVIGELEGKTSEYIQVQSHHDSAWPGAVEDASGTAEVMALAHYFGAQPADSMERSLIFTTFSSHWTGYQAHDTFAERYTAPDSPYDLVANVTVEHIGRHGIIDPETRELIVDDQPEPRAVIHNVSTDLQRRIAELIEEHDLRRTVLIGDQVIGMPTDAASIHDEGVPTVSFICGPAYLYDEIDMPDKVRTEDLAPVAQTFAELIETIDGTTRDQIGRDDSQPQPTGRDFDAELGGQLGATLDAIDSAG